MRIISFDLNRHLHARDERRRRRDAGDVQHFGLDSHSRARSRHCTTRPFLFGFGFPMPPTVVDAPTEASSIDRALVNLGLTTEDALERTLAALLPRVIEGLSTPHASNVPKYLTLLKHVNARVNARKELTLPLEAIVDVYASATHAMVRNFALVYVEKAFERSDETTREIQARRLLRGAAKRSSEHADVLCRLAFEALGTMRVGDSRAECGFLEDDADRGVFLRRARDFLAYSPNATGATAKTVANPLEMRLRALAGASIGVEGASPAALMEAANRQGELRAEAPAAPALAAPPMLSPNAVERLLGKGKPKPEPAVLARRKLRVLEFIAGASVEEAGPDEAGESESTESVDAGARNRFLVSGSEMLIHCLIASCDSDHEVAKRGEELLKRRCTWETNKPIVNLDDAKTTDELFTLFLGSSEDVPIQSRVLPASPAVKLKVMTLLSRSIAAADAFPKNIETVKMCLYGEGSTTRLKASGMQFTVWMLTHATRQELTLFAPSLMSGMTEILDSRADGSSEGDQTVTFAQESLRGFCYQALSHLAERDRASVNRDVLLAERIFEALDKEPDGVKSYVHESARVIVKAYRESPSTYVQTRMEELILLALGDVNNRTKRLVGAQWAVEMFPFSHVPSRFASIMTSGDPKHEMQVLGRRGLHPSASQESSSQAELTIEKWDGCDREVSSKTWATEAEMFEDLSSDHYRYMEYVAFCRGSVPHVLQQYPPTRCLLRYMAEKIPALRSDSPLHATLPLPEDSMRAALELINACLKSDYEKARTVEPEIVELYMHFLNRCLIKTSGPSLTSAALSSLIDLLDRDPKLLSNKPVADAIMIRLRHFVAHTDVDTRRRAAKLCGVLVAFLSEDARVPFLDEFLGMCEKVERGARLEHQEGAVCASGYMVGSGVISQADVTRAIKLYIGMANNVGKGQSAEANLAGIAAEAIGHASLRNSLPSDIIGDALAALSTVMQNTDPNVAKLATRAAGHVMLTDVRESTTSVLLPRMLSLADLKNDDAQFTIGEALTFAWGRSNVDPNKILTTSFVSLNEQLRKTASGDEADSMDTDMEPASRVESYDKDADERKHVHQAVLDAIFNQYIYSTRTERRCAACVWLLSLVTHTQNHPRLTSMLQDIQEAFGSLLGDQNDLTQELASRGMSVLYEMGDESQRKELLSALMGTLNGTAPKKRNIKLDGNAEVFEEGTIAIDDKDLRADNDKDSLTTYQELCSVVNDIGQPDLIYKFMDLANHQRALNSSRGAAFGFASIAKRAGEAVNPHLEKLVPKLYRMMHDPNPKMQEAVKGIWIALVDSPKATVDKHFVAIMDELLQEFGSRLWRSRQSSVSALGDILSGRSFAEVEPYLEKVWDVCLRSIDDIKETVRNAGQILCKSTRSLTLRLCDAHHSGPSDVSGTIKIVLPIMLEKGLMSTVKEVQALSMDVIMKLVKFADGAAIRPHIADIVKALLESLSGMEDARLNYIEQHAASFGKEASDRLEGMRLRAAKSSPMGETLDLLMAHIDESVMAELVSTMKSVLRTGVGLNTRAGAGRFLQRMCMRRGRLIRPHAGKLFSMLLSSATTDASAAVRASYISAIAAIAKYAEEPRVNELSLEIVRLFKSEVEQERSIAAQLALELSRNAPDALSPQKTLVLPLAFVGAHDTEDAGKSKWNEVWEENSGGVSATLRLYFDEILELAYEYLSAKQWQRKRQAAEVFTTVAKRSPDVLGAKVVDITTRLLAELPGRLWDGKTALLEAVSAAASACPKQVDADKIIDALMDESKRQKTDYRKAALDSLDAVLVAVFAAEVNLDAALVEKVVALVEAVLQTKSVSVDDIDSGVGAAGSLERMENAKYEVEKRIKASGLAATAAMTVLATVLNRTREQECVRNLAPRCISLCLASLDADLTKDRRRRGLQCIVGLMRARGEAPTFDALSLLDATTSAVKDTSSSALRMDAIDALSALAGASELTAKVKSTLEDASSNDQSPEVKRAAARALAELSGDSTPMN
jgi:proteasome component ECM29